MDKERKGSSAPRPVDVFQSIKRNRAASVVAIHVVKASMHAGAPANVPLTPSDATSTRPSKPKVVHWARNDAHNASTSSIAT